MNYDVTENRNEYIGGSDVPAIMGISPFKTRYELLLEKAGIEERSFAGNIYTEYGNVMEPKIRDYINQKLNTNFEPNRVIVGDFRYHSDGFNGSIVIEIKTTSQIHSDILDYKIYLVQLLKGMEVNNAHYGILCVYSRPDDFSTDFDPERLKTYYVHLREQKYKELLNEINAEIDRFRSDLERLKKNPLLSEEDFQPNELVTLSNKVLAFEKQLASYKALEKQYEDMKRQLFEAMQKYGVTSWETASGVKITRVDGTAATEEPAIVFDEDKFAMNYPDLYDEFTQTVMKKKNGRKGYVKITIPKGV